MCLRKIDIGGLASGMSASFLPMMNETDSLMKKQHNKALQQAWISAGLIRCRSVRAAELGRYVLGRAGGDRGRGKAAAPRFHGIRE